MAEEIREDGNAGKIDSDVVFTERKRRVFLGLPLTFTKYTVSKELIIIRRGFFNVVEDDCYLYKVADVKLETSFAERIAGLGTVHLFSADRTTPEMKLQHIRHARQIKDFILRVSEQERAKRHTVNTQSIDLQYGRPPMGARQASFEAQRPDTRNGNQGQTPVVK